MPKYKVGDTDIRYGKEGATEAVLLVAGSTVELEGEDALIIGGGLQLIGNSEQKAAAHAAESDDETKTTETAKRGRKSGKSK